MKQTLAALTVSGGLALGLLLAPISAQPPAGNAKDGKAGFGMTARDPRATSRTYKFKDTNEDMLFFQYVSSKVAKDKKAPLIVSLHGLGAGPGVMMTKNAIDLAEAGGYILVAPMGYNVGGWYGSPVMDLSGRGGKGKAPATPPPPANLAELSEKDVMNVLDLIRKEQNIDDKRIYLMGHSMGGAGTLFLGSKHANIWAAIGAEAPAAFLMANNRAEILKKITEPVIVVQGDADVQVPVANTRAWIESMKEQKLDYEYKELPGVDHGVVIEVGMAPIYEFFSKHSKK